MEGKLKLMQVDVASIVTAVVILIAVGVVFLIDSCFLRYKPVMQLVVLSIFFIMLGIFWIIKSYKK